MFLEVPTDQDRSVADHTSFVVRARVDATAV